MNASQVGKIHQQASSFINASGNVILIQLALRLLYKQINLLRCNLLPDLGGLVTNTLNLTLYRPLLAK